MPMNDVAESTIRRADERTREATGMSAMHLLTIGAIAASVGLYIAGRKQLAIFIGLWPPTLQAMRNTRW